MKPKRGYDTEYILLITYTDVFDGARPTLDEFRRRIAEMPKAPLVRVCSVLNAFIRPGANSPEPVNLAAHRGLVQAYFPPNIVNRILHLAHGTPRLVFHRQQLLFVAKEAIQYASDDPTRQMTNVALGELFLIANDHMHFEVDDEPSDDADKFAKIAATFLPLREAMAANVRHKMLRSYQMTKSAAEFYGSRPYFDLFALFKVATGLHLVEFYCFILAAISRFSQFDPSKYLADPSSYSLDERWFSSTAATPEAIQAFFRLTSATPNEYREQLKSNTGPNDFTVFRKHPMLRSFSKLDLLDFYMLAEKFDSGPFWEIHATLRSKQERDAFHSFWGKLFEKYIGELFKLSANGKYNRVHLSPKFKGTNDEFADVVIECGQSVVLIESKGTTFTAESKYAGNYRILRKALESKLVASADRPQAVGQLAKNIERAFGPNRDPVEGLDLRYTGSVFPVVITRDDLGGVPGVNAFLDLRFRALLNRKVITTSVAPLTCMSSEIAESICAYLRDTSLVDILEAHFHANHKGQARYLTMPLFTVPNTVLMNKGRRPIPNQNDEFHALVELCAKQLGLSSQITVEAND